MDTDSGRTLDFDRQLLALAGGQHYVVSRAQLRDFGSARQIEHRLAKRRLVRVHDAVYRVAGAPITWHQQLMAACLASSGANTVSFRAAAQLWGFPGGSEVVEVTAPRHRRMQLSGVLVHESFHLTGLDATYLYGLPVTFPARVICDLALLVDLGSLDSATLDLAMHEAVRRDLVDVASVGREWERLGGVIRPGGHVVDTLITGFVPPERKVDTRPELLLLQLLRAAELPEPQPQYPVDLSPTRSVSLDFAWPGSMVYCEFDPYKWHGARDKYMRDTKRRLELADLGWYGIPVTDDELDSGARLATQLLRRRLLPSE